MSTAPSAKARVFILHLFGVGIAIGIELFGFCISNTPIPIPTPTPNFGIVLGLSGNCLDYHESKLVFYLIFYLKLSFLSDFRA
jgi:hypothetical protein